MTLRPARVFSKWAGVPARTRARHDGLPPTVPAVTLPPNMRSMLTVFLLGAAFLLSGCAWTIVPPPLPDDTESETVFVTDYGRHARLGLPADDHTVWEWGFGDWDYYALEDRGAWSSLRALSFFGRSTLARRPLPMNDDTERFRATAGGVRTVAIEVGREKAARLLAELEDQWERGLEHGEAHRGHDNLSFVRAEERYHLFRNSNAKIATWLRALGCEVSGAPVLSNFRLDEPALPVP